MRTLICCNIRAQFFLANPYQFLFSARTSFVPVPHGYTSDHEYPTVEAHYNRSLYARTLPPVPKNCPTIFGVAGELIAVHALTIIIMVHTCT